MLEPEPEPGELPIADSDLKRREEAKRERMWDPRLRWQVIQDTLTWAEAQQTVRRNTKEECLRRQARHLRPEERRDC